MSLMKMTGPMQYMTMMRVTVPKTTGVDGGRGRYVLVCYSANCPEEAAPLELQALKSSPLREAVVDLR